MTNMYCKARVKMEVMKETLLKEEGMGTIEIAVIIIVLIGLALLFRQSITGFLNQLLNLDPITVDVPTPTTK